MGMETVTITRAEYEALQARNAHLEQQVQYLLEQMRLSRHRQFGSRSEKSAYDSAQLDLFNEAEYFASLTEPEPELQAVEKHYRKKRKELPSVLPENLPVEVVEHVLTEEGRTCPVCRNGLHTMGKETVRRELKLIPAKAVIVEHVRYSYSCRNCEKTDTNVPVVKAPVSKALIPGSFVTGEALAHIISQKFVMGVPLYRQEQEWQRQGVPLSRQTMSNWLLKGTETCLEPVYKALKEELLRRDLLHVDETGLQVLNEPGKAAQSKSYMWLYRTGSDTKRGIVLYEYQPDRKSLRVKEFLKDFHGYLHADGYSGYHNLPGDITVVGCWAHARRKFDETLKAMPENRRKDSGALIGKGYCDRLFAVEKELSVLTAEERYAKRQTLAKPVLDAFLAWLRNVKTGKSAFGNAVRYTLDQWKYLERYLLDGRLEISNNRAERSIKPFVIGRKNWLFSNTQNGARASAVMYSLVETAKENDLNPYEYLLWLFKNASQADTSKLLPWHYKHTKVVRSP